MIQTILLLLIPCICYYLAGAKQSDGKQNKQKSKQIPKGKQASSEQIENPKSLDSLFLDDDFDINDLIRNRSDK